MTGLPSVRVHATADGRGELWLNDQKIPAVLAVQVHAAAGEVPTVTVTVRPGELTVDLPETGVQLLRGGASAVEFADRLNPARLEGLALEHLEQDPDATQGEAWSRAVAQAAGEFDRAHGG